MSAADALIAVAIGLGSGVLSGLFGIGGGIVMTPAVDALLPVPSIAALETPLPVIFPTSITGAYTYWKAGEVDIRAATYLAPAGLIGSVAGALLTRVIDVRVLLLLTAILLAYQSVAILRTRAPRTAGAERTIGVGLLFGIGMGAGVASGLLGIGGGVVLVPLLAGWLGMPLKRALGTSLLTIPALVIPGTIVHAILGHIDWWLFVFLTIGAVPGARIGALLALGTAEERLRLSVGTFMLVVAAAYGLAQVAALVRGA
ncbi:MAG TPA: sulfite exporter TauE/SafE family protein [Actinomycetota bacterium]|nr:sulfite exporter TauE/SafE family protein [Actinomycetota bacterium]